MTALRAFLSALTSKGRISAGWYSILTGLALLYVTYLLSGAIPDDAAAPFVALATGVAGVWQVERGVRSEVRRRRAE